MLEFGEHEFEGRGPVLVDLAQLGHASFPFGFFPHHPHADDAGPDQHAVLEDDPERVRQEATTSFRTAAFIV